MVSATNFRDWLLNVLSRGQPSMFEEALMVSWSIWKDRNDFLWNKKINVIANVIVYAHLQNTGALQHSVLNQWNLARSNRFELLPVILHTYSSGEHWTAPDVGFVKVIVDGVVFAASQSYGVGGIARGNDGRVIEAFSLHKADCVHPSLVEAIGVIEALSWVKKKGWQHTTIEIDLLVVVQALENNIVMQSVFGSVIDCCLNLLKSLVNVHVCYVK
ncbi:uncharacterized protein LOC115696255 [Cannabis sativa]|uniref:uncharacterized protein LOC115696255 n=1 Tax=Cannabis sativa TaxID=3483 RepID=UPI0029CA8565|nr:uncharacterized protein LOC115696255 [Cannabis sativa]